MDKIIGVIETIIYQVESKVNCSKKTTPKMIHWPHQVDFVRETELVDKNVTKM